MKKQEQQNQVLTEEHCTQLKHQQNYYQFSIEEKEREHQQTQSQLHQTQTQLEETQQSLKFTQMQLEQSRLQAEIVLNPDEQYHLLVLEAWQAYSNDNLKKMAYFLQNSLQHKSFSTTEAVLDWLERFEEFATQDDTPLDIKLLTSSGEWRQLVRRLTSIGSLLINV
ncbi:MAG: hypothetical protein HC921_18920 [Synechococcaceae cyanobacterium SM2_3_1]|nr:hypothetical protein [Synechococcaceae cyanobacterium SM2_3_1]